MCGRITLQTPMQVIADLFGGLPIPAMLASVKPRYNLAPTDMAVCIRDQNGLEMAGLRWGLIPFWSKDLKIGARMINARSETVAEKPSFREAFKKRRCLVMADGFFEWKKVEDGKQPFYISRADRQPFAMAGLWESWRDKADPQSQPVETCTVITTSANPFMSPLHDRMPVILDESEQQLWLDPEIAGRETLESLLKPYDKDGFRMYPVSRFVNKAGNESEECVTEIEL